MKRTLLIGASGGSGICLITLTFPSGASQSASFSGENTAAFGPFPQLPPGPYTAAVQTCAGNRTVIPFTVFQPPDIATLCFANSCVSQPINAANLPRDVMSVSVGDGCNVGNICDAITTTVGGVVAPCVNTAQQGVCLASVASNLPPVGTAFTVTNKTSSSLGAFLTANVFINPPGGFEVHLQANYDGTKTPLQPGQSLPGSISLPGPIPIIYVSTFSADGMAQVNAPIRNLSVPALALSSSSPRIAAASLGTASQAAGVPVLSPAAQAAISAQHLVQSSPNIYQISYLIQPNAVIGTSGVQFTSPLPAFVQFAYVPIQPPAPIRICIPESPCKPPPPPPIDTSTLAIYVFDGTAWTKTAVTNQSVSVQGATVTISGFLARSGPMGAFSLTPDNLPPRTAIGVGQPGSPTNPSNIIAEVFIARNLLTRSLMS